MGQNPLNNRRKVLNTLLLTSQKADEHKHCVEKILLPSCTREPSGRFSGLIVDPVIVQLLIGSDGWVCTPVRATGGTRQAKSSDCSPPVEQHPKCLSECVTGGFGDWRKASGKGSSDHGELDDVQQPLIVVDGPHLHEADPAKGQSKSWTVTEHCKANTGD